MSFERYTEQSGIVTRARKGQNWKPRFYCDDTSWFAFPDADKPYTAKLPVVQLDVDPLVNFTDEDFTWDISGSNSPSSTISTYSVSFTTGASSPDITNAPWSGVKTGTVNWPTQGDYVIEATVTDILGVTSQVGSIMVTVVDFPSVVYIATAANGVYLMNSGVPTAINTGLTGDYLKVLDLGIAPWTRQYSREIQTLWISTVGGPAYTNDGGQSWTTFTIANMGTPANDCLDDPAPGSSDLYMVGLEYSKTSRSIYFTMAQASPGRMWVYKWDGEAEAWSNDQVAI